MIPGLILVCHAAPEWGFGHLSRSLAMATVAHEQGWNVYLVTRGPQSMIEARVPSSLSTVGIPQDAPLASEFECMRSAYEALTSTGAAVIRVMIDHPHVDANYAEGMTGLGIPWLTFSRLTTPPGPPNWVVSPVTTEESGIAPEPSDTHWLRGPAYAVLRSVFRQGCSHAYRPLGERRRLLVTFGGGNDFGASERLLSPILEGFPELEIELVTTRANQNLHRVETLFRHYGERLMLTIEPEEIADRMCNAGAAVTAGGTTTVELAALGIPFITVAIAENQEIPSRAWEDRGVSLHAGNLDSEAVADLVLTHIRQLLNNSDECLERSQRAFECVDGLGAQRILNHLIEEV